MFTFNSTHKRISVYKALNLKNEEAFKILNSVKPLPTIPHYNVVTLSQLEDYFEVGGKIISSAYYNPIYGNHYLAKKADGLMDNDSEKNDVVHMRLVDLKKISTFYQKVDTRYVVGFGNGVVITVPVCGLSCLNARAVLSMAMILNNSAVAAELRKAISNSLLSPTSKPTDNQVSIDMASLKRTVKGFVLECLYEKKQNFPSPAITRKKPIDKRRVRIPNTIELLMKNIDMKKICVQDAADMLGVSKPTWYRIAKEYKGGMKHNFQTQ